MIQVQIAEHPPTVALKGTSVPAEAALRRWLSHATQAHILYPAIAVLVLAAIWGTTLNLITVERAAAEQTAAASGRSLAELYKARVARALREIDQTLKIVSYAYELRGRQAVLQELKAGALLPPEFVVSIADSKGDIVASTQASAMANVANQDYFQSQRQAHTLAVGRPQHKPGSGGWTLQFSRGLNAADGRFSGIVIVSIDAAYLVSGYEPSALGEQGVLGILGTDGVFRVRRSGAKVSAGDMVDYAALVAATDGAAATPSTNAWDGVRRYTSARRLDDFPVAVIVGLSADEQLAAARRDMHAYLWRASAASVLLVLIMAMLGYMSRQLALSRLRAVEERIAQAERVQYLAHHDGLTLLPNRSLFSKLLGQSIDQAHRNHTQVAVLFLDLDRFKHINDSVGYEVGDQLLQEAAARLKACLRGGDTVARLGGDEFVLLLPELNEEQYVASVAQKVLFAIARPFVLQGREFRVTASVGISTYPKDGPDERTLTRNADIAMSKAKEEGKNKFQFYSENLNANSLERLTLESGLRHALERNEFRLHYEAKRDTQSGKITGMEVLLRWQNPELGTVAPARFIPVAEETGLMVPIGKWVLNTACLQNVAWQNQGLPQVTMAVKMTASQLYDQNLLPDLAAILEASAMDARLLELEIHESVQLGDFKKTLRVLSGIKDMGIGIAIHGIGIGTSTLSTLVQFPVDTIKLDRSFIRDATSSTEDKNTDRKVGSNRDAADKA